eukprot:gene9654-biopygen58
MMDIVESMGADVAPWSSGEGSIGHHLPTSATYRHIPPHTATNQQKRQLLRWKQLRAAVNRQYRPLTEMNGGC